MIIEGTDDGEEIGSLPGVGLVKRAARGVGRGVGAGVRGVGTGAAAVGRTVKKGVKAIDPPWSGGFTPGWVTRIGRRMANPIPLCSLKRYSKTKFCKAAGAVSWTLGKRAVEKAYGLPDGSLDQAENILNKTGRAPKGVPADVVTLLKEHERVPWWMEALDYLGIR